VSLSDALAARSYWIEILDGRPGKSGVEARVKSDNTIEIHSHDLKKIRLHLRPELLPKPGNLRIVWNGKKMFEGPIRDCCSSHVHPPPEIRNSISPTHAIWHSLVSGKQKVPGTTGP